MFPSILIQLENGGNEFCFYFYFVLQPSLVVKEIDKTKNKKTMAYGVYKDIVKMIFLLISQVNSKVGSGYPGISNEYPTPMFLRTLFYQSKVSAQTSILVYHVHHAEASVVQW